MDSQSPQSSRNKESDFPVAKKAKLAKKTAWKRYLTKDELEELLCVSDEDVDELASQEDDNSSDDGDVASEPEGETLDDDGDIEFFEPLLTQPTSISWSKRGDLFDIPFEGNNSFLVEFPGDQPINIFNLLFDEQLEELIVSQVNLYAETVFLKQGASEFSRMSQWRPLTNSEFRVFLGLIFHMGTIRLLRLTDYWKTDRLFNIPCFRESMSRDRFLLILRCLHFAPNPATELQKPEDRLFKIRPLINYFNDKMASVYYPQKNLCIDESMVLSNKRHKFGIKFYRLTEPTGIVLKFLISTGSLGDYGGSGHAAKIVLHLLENKLNMGHSIYLDNFYNSYQLSKDLLDKKTYSTGTLRINKKYSPANIKTIKLKKGETAAEYANGIMIGKWKDKRDVTYISTEFKNNLVTYFNKSGIEMCKPLPIQKYNDNMRGIDRQDQYYPCHRKTLRWYKKVGIHIFQILLLNSFFFYKKYANPSITLYDFRLEIIKNLLPQKAVEDAPKILSHAISRCSKNDKGITKRKRCKLCTSKGIRNDSSFECQACNAGFCLDVCFEEFHRKISE